MGKKKSLGGKEIGRDRHQISLKRHAGTKNGEKKETEAPRGGLQQRRS